MPWATGDARQLALGVLEKNIRSPLPKLDEITSEQLAQTVAANLRRTGVKAAEVAGEALVQNFASALTQIGIPSAEIFSEIQQIVGHLDVVGIVQPLLEDEIGGLPTAITKLIQSPAIQKIAVELLGASLAASQAQMIPVVGWLLALGVNTGRIVADAIKQKRREDLPRFYPPMVFDPDVDEAVYEAFVRSALLHGYVLDPEEEPDLYRPKDWTKLFQPPGTKAWVLAEEDGSVRIVGGAKPWYEGGDRTAAGLGIVPGSGMLHAGIDVRPGGKLVELGKLMPLAQFHGAALWQLQVVPNGPGLFLVEARRMRSLWYAYLQDLRERLDEGKIVLEFGDKKECKARVGKSKCDGRFGTVLSQQDTRRIINMYASPSLFGWADVNGNYWRFDDKGVVRKHGRKKADDPLGVKESLPIRTAEWLFERQLAALDTLTVAYVDAGFVAIASDTEFAWRGDVSLKERWLERREQSLTHRDRCQIEIDSVPDFLDGGIYKDKLIASGVGSLQCGLTDITAKPPLPKLAGPPLPTGMLGDGTIGGGGDAAVAAVALAAGLGALWALL